MQYLHPKFSNELGFWRRQPRQVTCATEISLLRSLVASQRLNFCICLFNFLSLLRIVDGSTKLESLISFMAGRTQRLSHTKWYSVFRNTGKENRIPTSSCHERSIAYRKSSCRLIKHSGSPNPRANFKDKLLTTMLK